MRSGVMRTRVRSLRPWRIVSWPAAYGLRCVETSTAVMWPSRTTSSTALPRGRIVPIPSLEGLSTNDLVMAATRRWQEAIKAAQVLGLLSEHAALSDIVAGAGQVCDGRGQRDEE